MIKPKSSRRKNPKPASGTVTVEVMGGLGNQLFQYAAGLQVALSLNKTLHLDTRPLDQIGKTMGGTPRDFELNNFLLEHNEINASRAKMFDLIKYLGRVKLGWIPQTLGHSLILEKGFSFSELRPGRSKHLYLQGYFQSEKYFTRVDPQLRKMLKLRRPASATTENLRRKILASPTVCVHVRRGDYTKTQNGLLKALDPSYYERAVEYLLSALGPRPIMVFSDNPQWCQENLNFGGENFTIVDRSIADTAPASHMYLMSACSNFIMSNSSFSWCAVWLSGSRREHVVTPREWFSNKAAIDTRDLIPESWRAIAL